MMKINLVFSNWTHHGRPITGEQYCELSTRDFHSGTTFDATIELNEEQAAELKETMAEGFEPAFWAAEAKEEEGREDE